jgi:hypothetical protein
MKNIKTIKAPELVKAANKPKSNCYQLIRMHNIPVRWSKISFIRITKNIIEVVYKYNNLLGSIQITE